MLLENSYLNLHVCANKDVEFAQENIKVGEWIPHKGPLNKVPSSSADIASVLRGYFCVQNLIMSFRFVSKQRKTSSSAGMSYLIFWLQARELRLTVCFGTFQNFNRSLLGNKRRLFLAQPITTEWTAEKRLDKRVQGKQTPKCNLANRTNRWSKVEAGARCPSSKKQFQQQRQQGQRQRRFKNDLIFNHLPVWFKVLNPDNL